MKHRPSSRVARLARSDACVGRIIASTIGCLQPLEYRRDALTAADAHGHQRVLAIHALQLVQRLGGDDRAGGSNRMAQGDGTAVRVGLGRVEAQGPFATVSACEAKASFDSTTSI